MATKKKDKKLSFGEKVWGFKVHCVHDNCVHYPEGRVHDFCFNCTRFTQRDLFQEKE